MKNILIISISNLKSDPRVVRQIEFLKDNYSITAFGLSNPEIEGVKFFKFGFDKSIVTRLTILFLRFIRLYGLLERHWIKKKIVIEDKSLLTNNFDLVIANDIDVLPFVSEYFGKTKIILDLHEYILREFEDKLTWRILYRDNYKYLFDKYLKLCNEVTTVCDGIANEYKKDYSVNINVITNAKNYFDLKPSKVDEKIKIIHHGAAISSRKIELMLEMSEYLNERFTLDLMLTPLQRNYYEKLLKLAEGKERVKIIPPVEMKDIVEKINGYDIGLFILPPTTFNYNYALPNKFFEFIQARLAIAIGPSPEMSNYVKKYNLGIISKSFDPRDMAEALNSLTKEKIYYYKTQSDKNAYILSSEENGKKLKQIVFNLIGN